MQTLKLVSDASRQVAHVSLIGPSGDFAVTCTAEGPGTGILVGRQPNPADADVTRLAQEVRWKTLTIDDRNVSANHLLVWWSADGLRVVDLSTNGSEMDLHRRQLYLRADDSQDIRIVLARPESGGAGGGDETEPTLADSANLPFLAALKQGVEQHLKKIGLAATVNIDERDVRTARSQGSDVFAARVSEHEWITIRSEKTQTRDALARLDAVIEWIERKAEERAENLQELCDCGKMFVLASQAMREVHRRLREAARRGRSVLLLGLPGVGKTTLVNIYVAHSNRQPENYREFNCGTLPPGFANATLFGSHRRVFTGVREDARGYFEICDNGVLCFDEVGDLDLPSQLLLLQVIESGKYFRVGEPNVQRTTRALTVFATNRNLWQLAEQGAFRKDLLSRLERAEVIEVPPLRDHAIDVEQALARGLVDDLSEQTILDALRADAREFLFAAKDPSTRYPWPGNHRELRGFMDKLSLRLSNRYKAGTVSRQQCEDLLYQGRPKPGTASAVSPVAEAVPEEIRAAMLLLRSRRSHKDMEEWLTTIAKPLWFAEELARVANTTIKDLPTREQWTGNPKWRRAVKDVMGFSDVRSLDDFYDDYVRTVRPKLP